VVRKLANGLTVMYVRRTEVPAVNATLVVRGAGNTDDPADLPGLASFTASMLDEGAAGRNALQLADALETLGASLSASSGWDATQLNLYALSNNFPQALRLMADIVARPDFPEREVGRLSEERPGGALAQAATRRAPSPTTPSRRWCTARSTRTAASPPPRPPAGWTARGCRASTAAATAPRTPR
jgi:zinc protease